MGGESTPGRTAASTTASGKIMLCTAMACTLIRTDFSTKASSTKTKKRATVFTTGRMGASTKAIGIKANVMEWVSKHLKNLVKGTVFGNTARIYIGTAASKLLRSTAMSMK